MLSNQIIEQSFAEIMGKRFGDYANLVILSRAMVSSLYNDGFFMRCTRKAIQTTNRTANRPKQSVS
jgi:hypothetical protein